MSSCRKNNNIGPCVCLECSILGSILAKDWAHFEAPSDIQSELALTFNGLARHCQILPEFFLFQKVRQMKARCHFLTNRVYSIMIVVYERGTYSRGKF